MNECTNELKSRSSGTIDCDKDSKFVLHLPYLIVETKQDHTPTYLPQPITGLAGKDKLLWVKLWVYEK
jgi:hypothetical protein